MTPWDASIRATADPGDVDGAIGPREAQTGRQRRSHLIAVKYLDALAGGAQLVG